jgi:hypothetical protein
VHRVGVHEGHPFLVEVGVALGGTLKPGINVFRFANRIPLLFEKNGDVVTQTAKKIKHVSGGPVVLSRGWADRIAAGRRTRSARRTTASACSARWSVPRSRSRALVRSTSATTSSRSKSVFRCVVALELES